LRIDVRTEPPDLDDEDAAGRVVPNGPTVIGTRDAEHPVAPSGNGRSWSTADAAAPIRAREGRPFRLVLTTLDDVPYHVRVPAPGAARGGHVDVDGHSRQPRTAAYDATARIDGERVTVTLRPAGAPDGAKASAGHGAIGAWIALPEPAASDPGDAQRALAWLRITPEAGR